MKVLAFGSSGFSGRHFVRATPAEHHVVPAGLEDVAGGIPCDVRATEQVTAAVRAAEASGIVNLVGPAPDAPAADAWAASVLPSAAILEAARQLPAPPRVLLIGSAAEYGSTEVPTPTKEPTPLRPATPYAVGKAGQSYLAAYHARRYGTGVVIARPFNLIGPGLPGRFVAGRIAQQIARFEVGQAPAVVRLWNVDGVRDFVDVRDAAAAYWQLLADGEAGEVYNVCTGEGHSIADLLERFQRLARRPFEVVVEHATPGTAADISIGDPTKLRRRTGWRPAVGLDDSLSDMLETCREAARQGLDAAAPPPLYGAPLQDRS